MSLFIDGLSDLTTSLLNFVGKEIFDYTKHSMLDDFQQAMTRYRLNQAATSLFEWVGETVRVRVISIIDDRGAVRDC